MCQVTTQQLSDQNQYPLIPKIESMDGYQGKKNVLWTYKDSLESRLTYHVVVDNLLEAFSALFQALLQTQNILRLGSM